jgi:uncharacterized protein YyaL (SSP411 family)
VDAGARPGRRPPVAPLLALLAALLVPTAAPSVPAAAGATRIGRADFLQLAEQGLAAARAAWWNPRLGWYDDRLDPTWHRATPLARLWSVYPLFETLDAVAIADPTPPHRAAVRAFAVALRRYWDPEEGAYEWYPGLRGIRQTYFDDNGWIAIGYADAYRATGDPRDLRWAADAFWFIVDRGWDAEGGGTWWDTSHSNHPTAEPLAAAVYVGVFLFEQTHDETYLAAALRLLAWADGPGWNAERGLYARNAWDPTVMDYVEGMMIGAHIELCAALPSPTACEKARELAVASARAFPGVAPWAPPQDAIYLRFLLDLYRESGDARWYRTAYRSAVAALAQAPGQFGLYVRHWDGRPGAGLLRDDAATLSLFAWLAASTPAR